MAGYRSRERGRVSDTPAEELRPGLWSFPIPIPGSPLGTVRVYAFELPGGGVLLVDTGWASPESEAALEAGLGGLGACVEDVRSVVITHVHPDHVGMAAHVSDRSGAWVGLHPDEARIMSARYDNADSLIVAVGHWLRECGTPEEEMADLAGSSLELRRLVTVFEPTVLIEDGDRVAADGWDLVAIHSPGHSPGHICLHERRTDVLLTGDHILGRITPNVSIHPQSGPDPLGRYMASLEWFRRFEGVEGLPGHGRIIPDVAVRAGELVDHHERQLTAAFQLVSSGVDTVYEVTRRFPWGTPWEKLVGFMRRSALGEAHAHLVVLAERGLIEEIPGPPTRWHPSPSTREESPSR